MAGERRGLLVSRVWIQATLLVVLCGFFILGLLAYRTYMAHPPVPKRVIDSQGRVLYTGRDIQKGQQVIPADSWPEKWARISFWSTNIGLAWMCFATLLPLGILQLYKSVNEGYFEARELKFLTNDTNALLEWLRLPGDILFIVGGALPALYIAYLGIRYTVKRVTLEQPDDILFTEIGQPEGYPGIAADEATAAKLT